jgi:hypothetical protein
VTTIGTEYAVLKYASSRVPADAITVFCDVQLWLEVDINVVTADDAAAHNVGASVVIPVATAVPVLD